MSPIDIQALGRAIHEVLILAVVAEGPKHGYQIALDVEEETGVFSFLHRLENRGFIEGDWDRSGGRRRKVYALTVAGRSHLESEGARIEEAFEALRTLLGGVE